MSESKQPPPAFSANDFAPPPPAFDHRARTTKYYEPLLGFCVCEHCKVLPWYV